MKETREVEDFILQHTQIVNNRISIIIRDHGTYNFEHMFITLFGKGAIDKVNQHIKKKEENSNNRTHSVFYLLQKYSHPLSYRVIKHTNVKKDKKTSPFDKKQKTNHIVHNDSTSSDLHTLQYPSTPRTETTDSSSEDDKVKDVESSTVELSSTETMNDVKDDNILKRSKHIMINDYKLCFQSSQFECYDMSRREKDLLPRMNNIMVVYHDKKAKKTFAFKCIMDYIPMQYYFNYDFSLHSDEVNMYLKHKYEDIIRSNQITNQETMFVNYVRSLTIRDMMLFDKNDILYNFRGLYNQCALMEKKTLNIMINEFLSITKYQQYIRLFGLLLSEKEEQVEMARILYELMDDDTQSVYENKTLQTQILTHLPPNLKDKLFDLNSLDATFNVSAKREIADVNDVISYEKQIALLKIPQKVKSKALIKIKQIKGKGDDNMNNKAQQWVEGLLSIPFGIERKEPILETMDIIRELITYQHKDLCIENAQSTTQTIYDIDIQHNNIYVHNHLYRASTILQNEIIYCLNIINYGKLIDLKNTITFQLLIDFCLNYCKYIDIERLTDNSKFNNYHNYIKAYANQNREKLSLSSNLIEIFHHDDIVKNIEFVRNMLKNKMKKLNLIEHISYILCIFFDIQYYIKTLIQTQQHTHNSQSWTSSQEELIEEYYMFIDSLVKMLDVYELSRHKFLANKIQLSAFSSVVTLEEYSQQNVILNDRVMLSNSNSDTNTLITRLFNDALENLSLKRQMSMLNNINRKWVTFKQQMERVSSILDNSVYGHIEAKKSIERTIGQWITGTTQGYCFGFEGPPGLGKTSIAKHGIAKCLEDENGVSRPFSFIALGGSNSSNILDGHGYTYVGSTWGRIVDILMESKCMNPIIMIDELDKVSRTEYGKEIVGLLTHLVDSTQNSHFHDKYFSGIDFDLSKALFIFSYNDPTLVDPILLDRIHRVKFSYLSVEEKIIVCDRFLLKELREKYNMNIKYIESEDDVDSEATSQNFTLYFTKEILKYIIDIYTTEPGVRRLKQLLNEIVGEINLQMLNNSTYMKHTNNKVLCIDELTHTYFKNRTPTNYIKVNALNEVGVMNGLWANSMGQGGIIKIQARKRKGNNSKLLLTGQQGDVMKESMDVAKTLAMQICDMDGIEYNENMNIHIHCPEGATPKDGPSAGTAITIALYSLMSNKEIPKHIGITGEINLQGEVTMIGGLDLKIVGAIRAGITTIFYPKDNEHDIVKFKEKLEITNELSILNNIELVPISDIYQCIDLVF